jgi:CDGSH-type Zn-finger protein
MREGDLSMGDPKIAGRQPAVLELEPGTYYWRRCGRSPGEPFCDGTHKTLKNE